MTLPELLIAIVIIGIIASAIATAFIVSFQTVGATGDRFTQSHDAQLLSFWITTDLQSVTASGITTSAGGTGCSGPALPAPSVNVLGLNWTDLSSSTTYYADYRAEQDASGQPILTRYYCTNGGTYSKFTVVHNVTSGPTPYTVSVLGKYVTLSVTTNGPNNQPYTFSVSGGGRTGSPGVPTELSATSQDSNNNGQVDHITVLFNRALTGCPSSSCTSDWTIMNQPGTAVGVHPTAVAIGSSSPGNNDEVILTLAETGTVDTVASGMTVSVTSSASGIQSLSGGHVAWPSQTVTAMTHASTTVTATVASTANLSVGQPVVIAGATGMTNVNGTWTIATITSATVFTFVVTTAPSGTYTASSATASGTPWLVADGMPPVLCDQVTVVCPGASPPTTKDPTSDGKLGEIDMAFTESVATTSFTNAPWTLGSASPSANAAPTGALVASTGTATLGSYGTCSNCVVKLAIDDTSEVVDTAATGLQIALSPNYGGVTDAAGNQSYFGRTTFCPTCSTEAVNNDGMAPVLMAATPADGTPSTSGTIDTGDTLQLTFSEPVTGLPAGSVTMTVTGKSSPNQTVQFAIPSLVTLSGTNSVSGCYYTSCSTSGTSLTATLNVTNTGASSGIGNESVATLTIPILGVTSANATLPPGGPALVGAAVNFTATSIMDSANNVAIPLPGLLSPGTNVTPVPYF